MACSKLSEEKTKIKSELKLLGKSEVEWEVVGWNGPFSHQMRSNASCLVRIPAVNNINSGIQLRFHLKPYQCHDELTQNFCTKKNNYISRSTTCKCSTCATIPLKNTTAKIPHEFLPETGTQSAGYSLLVDVLSSQPREKVMLSVFVEKLNGQKCTVSNKTVFLNSTSESKDLVVKQNFWRMLLWTVDEYGNAGNFTSTLADTVNDAFFHVSVTAYEIVSTEVNKTEKGDNFVATETKALEHTLPQGNSSLEKRLKLPKKPVEFSKEITKNLGVTDAHNSFFKMENPYYDFERLFENFNSAQSVVLKCHYRNRQNKSCVDVMRVTRARLNEKSAFFRRELDKLGNGEEIDLHVDPDALHALMQWIVNDVISTTCYNGSQAEEICHFATYLELDNASQFWRKMEEALTKACESLSMAMELGPVAQKYKLTKLMKHINEEFPNWAKENERQRDFLSNHQKHKLSNHTMETSVEDLKTVAGTNGTIYRNRVVPGTIISIPMLLGKLSLPTQKGFETEPVFSILPVTKDPDFFDMLNSSGSESSFEDVSPTQCNKDTTKHNDEIL